MFQNPTYGDASEFMRFEEVSYVTLRNLAACTD